MDNIHEIVKRAVEGDKEAREALDMLEAITKGILEAK
jgi:hypothetical protein